MTRLTISESPNKTKERRKQKERIYWVIIADIIYVYTTTGILKKQMPCQGKK